MIVSIKVQRQTSIFKDFVAAEFEWAEENVLIILFLKFHIVYLLMGPLGPQTQGHNCRQSKSFWNLDAPGT